ncbi:MAG: TOBE domain-containing protein [Propionibacteriaceae bacterium]|nr:TOBE domain-containing protein [Propionibacteriaceae bacterium]
MTQLRISEVAALVAVSDDTVRRWIEAGRISSSTDDAGRQVLDGAEVAAFVQGLADDDLARLDPNAGLRSARNSFTGLVTRVVSDQVMSQVEVQCGRFRVVSLISTEAVRELGLEVGTLATAVVKATNVTIERPRP